MSIEFLFGFIGSKSLQFCDQAKSVIVESLIRPGGVSLGSLPGLRP
jgi:hypothetical protein